MRRVVAGAGLARGPQWARRSQSAAPWTCVVRAAAPAVVSAPATQLPPTRPAHVLRSVVAAARAAAHVRAAHVGPSGRTWMQRLDDAMTRGTDELDEAELASLREELAQRLASGQAAQEEVGDAALALGTMAAAGIGGGTEPCVAETSLLMAAEAQGGNDDAAGAVFYRLAQLHLSALAPSERADVEAFIRSGYHHESAEVSQQVQTGRGREEISPELARAVRRDIRLLIKQVRVAKQKGAPVKSFRPTPTQPQHPAPTPAAGAAGAAERRSGGGGQWAADGEKGLLFLRTSADLGFADAQVLLGNLLVSGEYAEIMPSHRAAVVAGNMIEVQPVVGQAEGKANALLAQGVQWYERAAEGGHADAWYNLGMLHGQGKMVVGGLRVERPDMRECWRCMRAAADLGDTGALYWMATRAMSESGGGAGEGEVGEGRGREGGAACEEGKNGPADDVVEGGVDEGVDGGGTGVVGMEQALTLLEQAADGGHAGANLTFALLLREAGDLAGMCARLERAAAEGDAQANYVLGDMLLHGSDSYAVDKAAAFDRYMAAARERHAEALCCVAAMYYQGTHVDRDLTRAFRCYQLAAEEGSTDALRNLAAMHYAGEGCEESESTARYLLKVVKQREAEAEAADSTL